MSNFWNQPTGRRYSNGIFLASFLNVTQNEAFKKKCGWIILFFLKMTGISKFRFFENLNILHLCYSQTKSNAGSLLKAEFLLCFLQKVTLTTALPLACYYTNLLLTNLCPSSKVSLNTNTNSKLNLKKK